MADQQEERSKFLFNASSVDIPQSEEGKKRTFKGQAYGGGRVDGHWYWGRSGVVFDLEGIEIQTPTPLLGEHFSSSRIGVVKTVNTINGITVEGDFLSNTQAKEFVQDADDGFPFQMSMFIDPGSVEDVSQGQKVTVNGQVFEGPIAIFRNNRIREFTICSTGADRSTSIQAFSAKNQNQNQTEDTDVTELEQTKQALKQAEQDRDAARNELQQFKASKRTEDIEALAADLKTQFSAEDKAIYQNMDDATFAFTAKNMRQFSSKPSDQQQQQKQGLPSYLTQHQAGGDQGQQQFNGGGQDQHRFATGIQKLQEMNKAGK